MHEIIIQAKLQRYQNEREIYLFTEIEIGELLLVNHQHDGLDIDLAELARSLSHDGEFFIITCACGDPGCAGIKRGIQVRRDSKNIHWNIRDWGKSPLSAGAFSFSTALYTLSVRRAIRQFLSLHKKHPDAEISPYLLRDRVPLLKAIDQSPWPAVF